MFYEDWETLSIAIDGLAGTGKSTIARNVAIKAGLAYLDTGATYRVAALVANQLNLSLEEVDDLIASLSNRSFEFRDGCLYLDGLDVSVQLRTPEISECASRWGTHPQLRQYLVQWQRSFGARTRGVVMEGRDIGSVVLPRARLKIYLFADDEVRNSRRLETPADQLLARDRRDAMRATDPVRAVFDAVTIDSSNRTIAELTDEIFGLYRLRIGC